MNYNECVACADLTEETPVGFVNKSQIECCCVPRSDMRQVNIQNLNGYNEYFRDSQPAIKTKLASSKELQELCHKKYRIIDKNMMPSPTQVEAMINEIIDKHSGILI